MALVFTNTSRWKEGKFTKCKGTVAFDSSYPTGGEDYSAGLGTKVVHLEVSPSAGYVFSTDYTNKKILAYYADYSTSTDAALIQVPDTTDISGITAANYIVTLK